MNRIRAGEQQVRGAVWECELGRYVWWAWWHTAITPLLRTGGRREKKLDIDIDIDTTAAHLLEVLYHD